MFATIANVIDFALVAIYISWTIKTIFFGEIKFFKLAKADRKEFLRGAAYGFSRAVLSTVYDNGVRWVSVAVSLALCAGLWYIGLQAYVIMNVAVLLSVPFLFLVPEPQLTAMEKSMLDLQIRLGGL